MTTASPLPEEPPALPDPVSPNQEQSPENRKIMSRRLIIQAKKELEDGERLQAGEKAWGAVAQHLKIIGEQRGWSRTAHRHLDAIGRHIVIEYNEPGLANALSDAYHKGHENFYENQRSIEELEETIDGVEEALPVLEAIESEGPRYFRINSNNQLRRLRELTGDHDLQIGDESNVGFSLRHLSNFND